MWELQHTLVFGGGVFDPQYAGAKTNVGGTMEHYVGELVFGELIFLMGEIKELLHTD